MKGIFRARAEAWGLGVSGTGKEQVGVTFKLADPAAELQNLTWYGYFTDGTFERTVESLRHCGWKGDDLSDGLTDLNANEVDLVVEEEEYEGKVQTKVQWVNRVGGLALKTPLAGEQAKAFGAAMKDRIRALDAAGGRKKASGTAAAAPRGDRRPEPPPQTDFDVPF